MTSLSGMIDLIALMFLSHRFQTELGYDILEIHDGPNLLSPLIGSFNGTQVPQFLFSSSNFLYLLFITDNSRSNVGFKILYESKSVTKSGFDIIQTWSHQQPCWMLSDHISLVASGSHLHVQPWPLTLQSLRIKLYAEIQSRVGYNPHLHPHLHHVQIRETYI